jgi:phosphoribosylamine--glycine ligase
LLSGVAENNLHTRSIETYDRHVSSVMLVSGGYPGSYDKGKVIKGFEKVSQGVVFHAGTKLSGGEIVSSGGRVLACSSWGSSLDEALAGSYQNASELMFEGKYYRKDIGFDLR